MGIDIQLDAAVTDWAAVVTFAVTATTVPALFTYQLTRLHARPFQAAIWPFEILVILAARLALTAAAAYGAWVVFDRWGVWWLVGLLGPSAVAIAAALVSWARRRRRSQQLRHRQVPAWIWWVQWRLGGLRTREDKRAELEIRATAWQKRRDRWARRSVLRYLRWRDGNLCGGCGHEMRRTNMRRKRAWLSDVVPNGFTVFDVDALGRAKKSGTDWKTKKWQIDNAQAVCSKGCRASGRKVEEWRHPDLLPLPAATSRNSADTYLWLPWSHPGDGT